MEWRMATTAAALISKNNGIDFSFLAQGRISRTSTCIIEQIIK